MTAVLRIICTIVCSLNSMSHTIGSKKQICLVLASCIFAFNNYPSFQRAVGCKNTATSSKPVKTHPLLWSLQTCLKKLPITIWPLPDHLLQPFSPSEAGGEGARLSCAGGRGVWNSPPWDGATLPALQLREFKLGSSHLSRAMGSVALMLWYNCQKE